MRIFVFVLISALVVNAAEPSPTEPGGRERTFIRALEQFDHATTPQEYREAGQLFESLVSNDYENGAIYYNAGNSYFRAGDFGRAIANYRKAKIYRPRDARLDANLRQALAVAPGRLQAPPEPLWKHIFFWSEWLSYPEKFYAAFGVLCVAALCASAALLLRARRLYWAGGAAVIVALVLAIDAGLTDSKVRNSQHAVVTTETMPRLGSGERYEPAFNQPLKDGAEFTIIDRNGDWVLGHFEGIGDGWVRHDAIAE